jgi:hypothetical protein
MLATFIKSFDPPMEHRRGNNLSGPALAGLVAWLRRRPRLPEPKTAVDLSEWLSCWCASATMRSASRDLFVEYRKWKRQQEHRS